MCVQRASYVYASETTISALVSKWQDTLTPPHHPLSLPLSTHTHTTHTPQALVPHFALVWAYNFKSPDYTIWQAGRI